MRKILRPKARKILRYLATLTLKKHKPKIIAVVGDGQTSIAREVIYSVLKEKFPRIRRNLESPEAEFSVPLTIIGYLKYPQSYAEWLFVMLKTAIQLLIIKPYRHVLVLELSNIHKDIQNYWLKVIKPDHIIDVASGLSSKKYLDPYFTIAKNVGAKMGMSTEDIENGLNKVSLPTSKIRLLKGRNKSLIIDASHYYFPTPVNSVLEIADSLEGRKIAFVEAQESGMFVERGYLTNPKKYEPKKDDVIIIRGQKMKTYLILKRLSA